MNIPNNIIIDSHSLVGVFILNCVGKVIKEDIKPNDDGSVDAVFTINGIEIPFEEVLTEWNQDINSRLNVRAAQIVKDKAYQLQDKFDEIQYDLQYKLDELKNNIDEIFEVE
jgi:hypothetical protein